MSAVEELENELVEILLQRKEGERREAKIKMQIRAIKPDFVDLDVMEVLNKPLSEQLDPITLAQRDKQEG
jgi:hypothetical protein